MAQKFIFWIEEYLFNPNLFQKFISLLLLPLSFLYCFIVFLRFRLYSPKDLGVKVVSVGNLVVGGSGKTPLTIALAKNFQDVAIVLRGYGRSSKGLVVVKDKTEILVDVKQSGDEAQIYADKLKDAVVIVSEDRIKGIKKAKELGSKIIFLDDGYSKHYIKKLDIVIDVDSNNKFCLPSGAFREKLWKKDDVLLVKEGVDFKRKTTIINPTEKMALLTAIARPKRLDKYLPKEVVKKYYFEDHHNFSQEEVEKIFNESGCNSLLVTYKDYVKLKNFDVKLSILDLDIEVDKTLLKEIYNWV